MDARVKPAHDELVTTSVDIAPFGITPSCTIAFLFRRGTRWPVRFLYFPVFLQIRHLPSPVSRSQTTHTPPFPRRMSAPGVLHRCFTHPESRGGRSAEKRSGARRNTRGACHLASKTRVNALMTRDARLSALHRGGFSPGAALPSPSAPAVLQRRAGALRIRAASSSQPGRSAWRAGSRASRGQRLRAAAAGRHSPLRLRDRLRRRPSMSEDGNPVA